MILENPPVFGGVFDVGNTLPGIDKILSYKLTSLSPASCKTGVVGKKYVLPELEAVAQAIVADLGEILPKPGDHLVRAFEIMILIEAQTLFLKMQ